MRMFRLLLVNVSIVFEVFLVFFIENYFSGICIMFEYVLFFN